jgi:hypothetical protein
MSPRCPMSSRREAQCPCRRGSRAHSPPALGGRRCCQRHPAGGARAHELLVGFLARNLFLDRLVGHITDSPVAGRAKVRVREKERSAANAIRNAAAKSGLTEELGQVLSHVAHGRRQLALCHARTVR